MPAVYPFRALTYASIADRSAVVAPPYDVLDAAGKAALLKKDSRNIVAVDLPHTPAKELGPASAYAAAAETLQKWIADGILKRGEKPAIFMYRQTFRSADGSTVVRRSGVACTLDVVPFGPRPGVGGVLPHEETFSGPKEDRYALMAATRTQLSPIFGLHADEDNAATALTQSTMAARAADFTATTADGTLHECWEVTDPSTVALYSHALSGEDVFIADGHHRYTTAVNYLRDLSAKAPGGVLDAEHPARRCLFVLISMNDPGLVIWPTHRVLGGMSGYSLEAFMQAAGSLIRYEPIAGGLEALARAVDGTEGMGPMRFGLYDVATKRGYVAMPSSRDPLQQRFPNKPSAWRELVVAFTQYAIVEDICQRQLNDGKPVKWAFPHTVAEVESIASGEETGAGGGAGFAQLVVLVRPTPLAAVREVSRANELMPQKSTFFYPKLATGLWMHPLE
jgi:uncharacterized protein (DUF1015 family)